jgi:tricorn protease
MNDDFSPAFDPEGKYRFFVSRRTFTPEPGAFEFDIHFGATDKLYALPLQDTTASPVAPESDEETGEDAANSDAGKGDKAAKEAKGAWAPGRTRSRCASTLRGSRAASPCCRSTRDATPGCRL